MEDTKTESDDAAPASDTGKTETPDPVKEALEKERGKTEGKTELEKALFARKSIDQRIKDLGGEPQDTEEDSEPVTVGMLKKREQERAQKTALQLAENITDTDERELTKLYLETRVRPSGNPEQDLRDARALVNSVKNTQIIEEVQRKKSGKTTASSAGAPAPRAGDVFEPTPEEARFMRAPFNLKEKDILAARKAQE